MSNQENIIPTSGLYTCLSCQIAFQTADAQRLHYRSDWHRYNLKRKVAGLPPVQNDQFQQKSVAVQEAAAQSVAKAEVVNRFCATCRKSFGTENAEKAHLQSKKHKENEVKAAQNPRPERKTPVVKEQRVDMTITDDMGEEEINERIDQKIKAAPRLEETDCLFCKEKSDTFEDNMNHMTAAHSFFIPDIEYLADMRGLIHYLGQKISIGNVCLLCNGRGRGFRSLEAVRTHMIDKSHCAIAYEDDDDAAELVDYYDFSSSNDSNEAEEEDVDAELSRRTEQIRLADDNMSLVLPNGSVIGHRDLKRYYDQKFKPVDTRDSVLINKLIGHYTQDDVFESLRSSGNRRLLVTDGRRSHTRATEAFKDKRIHQDYKTRVGLQSNKLQKYFREQII